MTSTLMTLENDQASNLLADDDSRFRRERAFSKLKDTLKDESSANKISDLIIRIIRGLRLLTGLLREDKAPTYLNSFLSLSLHQPNPPLPYHPLDAFPLAPDIVRLFDEVTPLPLVQPFIPASWALLVEAELPCAISTNTELWRFGGDPNPTEQSREQHGECWWIFWEYLQDAL
ncbi:hypothetical protein WG66_004286 [Moniliophthora roreri]|nr:hypothetical protein WG66_004286 [Moniliophthora roreri]